MKIKPTLDGFSGEQGSMLSLVLKNPECANSYHENPPNRMNIQPVFWTQLCGK